MRKNSFYFVAGLAIAVWFSTTLMAASPSCGLKGTLQIRTQQCATSATINGSNWNLVSRSLSDQTVWQDGITGLLWSEQVTTRKALADVVVLDDDGKNILRETYCNSPATAKLRGGLTLAKWRVPSQRDWELALSHGLKKLLPRIEDEYFWTSTPGAASRDMLALNGYREIFEPFDVDYKYISLKCIANP